MSNILHKQLALTFWLHNIFRVYWQMDFPLTLNRSALGGASHPDAVPAAWEITYLVHVETP